MQQLESQAYNFTVKAIGFIKSLEKVLPHLVNEELRKSSSEVSLRFMEAMNADQTKDFSDNIRNSYQSAQQSFELLKSMNCSENKELEKQKAELLTDLHEINVKLSSIIIKLIY